MDYFDELVKKRHLTDDFLNPKYLPDKLIYKKLPDIDKLVKRIKRAKEMHEKVMVYGDYDVDGVTATSLMVSTLKMAGITDVITMLPDRFIDGYGMSERAATRAKKEGVKLVITVDCGSNNADVIEELTEEKIDTLVTDHHEVMAELPKAVAVVNPKRRDDKVSKKMQDEIISSGLLDLAGVGVAFMVTVALVDAGLIKSGYEKWLLDLVLIGTICDSMQMTQINRELCFFGAKVLPQTKRVGLKELMRIAKVDKISSHAIGFQIGPRLNAGGRMKTAEISLGLLTSNNRAEAAALAKKLDELNQERRHEQITAVKEVENRKEEKDEFFKGISDKDKVIVVAGKWHEGILGIVAGRLMEKYQKPVFVLGGIDGDVDADGVIEKNEVILKGSGRSFGDYNLAEAIKYCKDTIISGGGHAAACGVKLKKSKLGAFRKAVNKYYDELKLKNQSKYLVIHEDIEVKDLNDISVDLCQKIAQLEPYGEGNKEPIFYLKNITIRDVFLMGNDKNHLRLTVRKGTTVYDTKFVAFFVPDEWLKLQQDMKVNLMFNLNINHFNGNDTLECVIQDITTINE